MDGLKFGSLQLFYNSAEIHLSLAVLKPTANPPAIPPIWYPQGNSLIVYLNLLSQNYSKNNPNPEVILIQCMAKFHWLPQHYDILA